MRVRVSHSSHHESPLKFGYCYKTIVVSYVVLVLLLWLRHNTNRSGPYFGKPADITSDISSDSGYETRREEFLEPRDRQRKTVRRVRGDDWHFL